MSFRNDKDAWSASLYWQENPEQFQIQIVAPLAQGSLEITGDDNTVRINTDDGQSYQQDEVELMMLQNFGWRVPVAAMRYWVKGMPDSRADIKEQDIDELGRLTRLTQSGWAISYQTYTRVNGHQLPTRIDLQRNEVNIRMIINYWNLSP
jgi:outer membrane lipoprotein LolB